MVHSLRNVAGELDVLPLVVADRDEARVVKKDVGGHQRRIGEKPRAGALALLAALLLELRHALEPTQWDEALQDPRELGVRRDVRLDKHGLVFPDPTGLEDGGKVQRVLPKSGRVLWHRDRVEIHDAEDVLVAILVTHPVANRAEVVADMEATAGLDPGKDTRLSAGLLHRHMLREGVLSYATLSPRTVRKTSFTRSFLVKIKPVAGRRRSRPRAMR